MYVNLILSSLNSFFVYNVGYYLKVKMMKIQKRIFASYLRPDFYIDNEEKVRAIIPAVITQYANGVID